MEDHARKHQEVEDHTPQNTYATSPSDDPHQAAHRVVTGGVQDDELHSEEERCWEYRPTVRHAEITFLRVSTSPDFRALVLVNPNACQRACTSRFPGYGSIQG